MAPECSGLNKRLAELISSKAGEAYHDVIRHLRLRLRFATLIAVRGVRGKRGVANVVGMDEVSFNLIPRCDEL